jgi:RNA polymerase sigma-70 factor (ECF subfamily)
MPEHEPDDEQLILRAKQDPLAFGPLYDKYSYRIYRYIYRQIHNEALANDITSITFEKAMRGLPGYQWQNKSFCAWLYRIARNEIIRDSYKKRLLAPFSFLRESPTEKRGLELRIQQHEQYEEIRQALARLSDKDRELISLRFFEDLSVQEVSEVLNISITNVYVRLHRALKRLKAAMEMLPAALRSVSNV